MKTLATLLVVLVYSMVSAQNFNKVVPVQQGQKISMRFDYPDLVKVTTWDKNEISIVGDININDGENNDAFQLESSTSGSTVTIKSSIKDLESLPKRIMVIKDNKKITFRSREEYRKYVKEFGRENINVYSDGSDIDITLEIKVPRTVDTRIISVYGMVEVRNFEGPLQVDATYGGVDVALNEKSIGELTAETDFGQIYTNLDSKTVAQNNGDFHTEILLRPGVGARYSLESKYGNVYLRKN